MKSIIIILMILVLLIPLNVHGTDENNYLSEPKEHESSNQPIEKFWEIKDDKIISKCDESVDNNKNGIPDELEKTTLSGISREVFHVIKYNVFKIIQYSGLSHEVFLNTDQLISNKNWSYCSFPDNMSNYRFVNSNLSYADFSNSQITNSMFHNVDLTHSNFSNTNLYGVIFLESSLSESNFVDADFYPKPWQNPFIIFTMDSTPPKPSCYFRPCTLLSTNSDNTKNQLSPDFVYTIKNIQILNLRFTDIIDDKSDRRELYRHVTGFYSSNLDNTVFKNTNLSHSIFSKTNISNTIFSSSNLDHVLFDDIFLKNTKINDEYYESEIINNTIIRDNNSKQIIFDKPYYEFHDKQNKITIKLIDVLDSIPINYAMGMTVNEQNLYVADTDNHRINVYNTNTFDKYFEFSSPLQHFCKSTHTWTDENKNCTTEKRNLPTSIAVIDKKIFVSYGFQNNIQIFDFNGNYLKSFGNLGDEESEFDHAYKITSFKDLLYVADSANYRIQVFNSDGNFIRQFPIPITNNSNPIMFDIDIWNNQVFVTGTANSSILVIDEEGNFLKKIPLVPTSEYDSISSIDVHDELIFLTDPGNDIVKIIDFDGILIGKFGKTGQQYGEFNQPYEIVVNGSKIYISDVKNYRIQIFDIMK